uniref:Uncharacterized protein n=1 Tax=Sphaerodactylus townsendi TaxID=933632 RepID=A0ACB8FPL3_9SAUR
MLALYRSQVYGDPPSPSQSALTSFATQVIMENKRGNPAWKTKASLKRPRLNPKLRSVDSSDSEPPGRKEGEVLSDQEHMEDMKVTEQSSRFFKFEDYQYLLSKSVAVLHLGEAQSREESSKRKSTSLHKGDGEFFPTNANSKKWWDSEPMQHPTAAPMEASQRHGEA